MNEQIHINRDTVYLLGLVMPDVSRSVLLSRALDDRAEKHQRGKIVAIFLLYEILGKRSQIT